MTSQDPIDMQRQAFAGVGVAAVIAFLLYASPGTDQPAPSTLAAPCASAG